MKNIFSTSHLKIQFVRFFLKRDYNLYFITELEVSFIMFIENLTCLNEELHRHLLVVSHVLEFKDLLYFIFVNIVSEIIIFSGDDYVTEKFFLSLQLNVVPVVFGGADYSTISPPNSYINALDYPTPKILAQHLIYIASNEVIYNK